MPGCIVLTVGVGNSRDVGMPYQVRAGSVTAIVANEKQALEVLRRMVASGKEKISVRDIFGGEVDVSTLELRLKDAEPNPL
jgi:hypothetical protein